MKKSDYLNYFTAKQLEIYDDMCKEVDRRNIIKKPTEDLKDMPKNVVHAYPLGFSTIEFNPARRIMGMPHIHIH